MPITASRKRKRGRNTASGEKERESIASLFTDDDYEGLKADLNLFQQFHAQNPKDVQNLRNLGLTMTRLASTPSLDQDMKQIINWFKGGAEMLGEVTNVDAGDHEAFIGIIGRKHMIVSLSFKRSILRLISYLLSQQALLIEASNYPHRYSAPEVYNSVPLRLERARDSLLELCPKARNSESSDEEFSDSSDMSDQSCNMRQDMIQDAVKMLLKAMSILIDDNGEVVDKLANQIYFSPCTGNTQGTEYRGGLLASGKDAKDALVQDSRYAPELKEQALALIFLRETQTRKVDTNITETQLQDAITILEEVLMIHPNDCEATLSLGKGHYYLWLDSTLHLDSDVRESYRQKAIKYFSDVRDKPATAVMLKKVENLLDTLCERHTEDNLNRATDENVMLMKFVRVLFEAMSLGTYKRCRDAGEKSVKDHLLVQELDSLRRHVDTIMMKLSESP